MRRMAARLRLFASFWLYPLLGLLLAAITGIPDALGSGWALPLWIGVGVAGWTLIEYGLHRFVFHPGARLEVLKATAYRMHGRHHQNPRNPRDILVSPEFSLITSAVIFGLLWLGPMDAASAAA